MPVPKRRKSKSKKGMRRAHQHLAGMSISLCPRCKTPKLPHHVCTHCGYYKDRDVLKLEEQY
ncbi:MAG: 50S ribosomal protein L32 [Deltaproteobacteria bacterium]|nr:50S ribosomal protein L32 [Deltaproteobacteria bacterium]